MYLKRVYCHDDADHPRCTGVELRHTGTHAEQNFPMKVVLQAVAEGWMEVVPMARLILLKTDVGVLRYAIKREPGHYCCHNGERIPISDLAQRERMTTGIGRLSAKEARAYMDAAGFSGVPSPDPQNPSGYMVLDHYECVLEEESHTKYKAVPGALATIQRAINGSK